jgi:putative DNA primase/helicase
MQSTSSPPSGAIASRPARPADPIWDNIADELFTEHHWAGWVYELRKDRWTKRPRKANGAAASSTDPASWCRFEDIQEAYYILNFDGIGAFLHPPFVAFDFDHVINPATGNLTDPHVESWLELLKTYFETSPGGDGLRGFAFGKLPHLHRKLGNYECYSADRFVTLTGRVFGERRPIRECQAEIDLVHSQIFAERIAKQHARVNGCGFASSASISLSDTDLLEHARAARNGDKFAALYDRGDISQYSSHSEADFALCSRLYFWCGGDAERIARLWRSSALARDKLMRGDYVARTIDAVLASGGPTYTSGYNMAGNGAANNGSSGGGGSGNQQKGSNIRRASIRLSTVTPKVIEWHWPDVLPLGMVSAWIADPGVGKSIASRDIAARTTTGAGFPGGFACEPGSVIFVDDENGVADTIRPSIDAQGGDPNKIFIFKLRRDPDGAEVQPEKHDCC